MMIRGNKTPCLNCPDRRLGCHGQDEDGRYLCERYGSWKAERKAAAARRDQEEREQHDVLCAHGEGVKVYRNRKRKVPR